MQDLRASYWRCFQHFFSGHPENFSTVSVTFSPFSVRKGEGKRREERAREREREREREMTRRERQRRRERDKEREKMNRPCLAQ